MPVDTGEYADGEMIREPYDVKVFDSPVDLFNAIHAKAQLKPDGWDGAGLSRCWPPMTGSIRRNLRIRMIRMAFWNVNCIAILPAYGVWDLRMTMDSVFTTRVSSDQFCKPWNYQLRFRSEKQERHRQRTVLGGEAVHHRWRLAPSSPSKGLI